MFGGSLEKGVRGRWLTALVCASVLATAGPAWPQGTADEMARRHFDSGAAYLHESDYENALRAFEKAYELSNRPEIQLNIATVHERTGNLSAAISALNAYLAQQPEGEHAETVRLRIENLEKRLAEQPPDAGAPPAEATDAGAAEPSAPPATATAPEAAAPPPPPAPPPAAPPPEQGPNIAAYVALGVGGLAAVGAGVTGYLAESEYADAEDSCSPDCTDDELSTGRTHAWTSTILTGVAAVGVGVGLVLLLSDGEQEQPPTAAGSSPEVFVGFGPQGAAANATWRF